MLYVLLNCNFVFAGDVHELHIVQQIYDINNEVPRNLYLFRPEYLSIKTGDTIHFTGTTKGHTVHSVKDMIPEGAEKISIMPRQNSHVKFIVPGVYGIRCKKHDRHGMVAVVVVGDDIHNINRARKAVPRWVNHFVQKKMLSLLDHAESEVKK